MSDMPFLRVDFRQRQDTHTARWPAFVRADLFCYTSGNGYAFRLADHAGNIVVVEGTGRDSVRCLLLDKVATAKRQRGIKRAARSMGLLSDSSWRAFSQPRALVIAVCESALAYGKRAE